MNTLTTTDSNGKLTPFLPSDNELETNVLGSFLTDSKAFDEYAELLFDDLFCLPQNKVIFKAMRELNAQRKPIDLMTVVYQLKAAGELDNAGGPFYLSTLAQNIASAANVEYHIRILQQLWLRRRIIEMGIKLQQQAQADTTDIFELLSELQVHAIQAERLLTSANGGERIADVLDELEATFEMTAGELQSQHFPVGIEPLDKLLNDLRHGELMVIAGIPGSGKTALAINIASNLAFKYREPVAVFSYEMTKRELLGRVLSDLAEVDSKKIGRKELFEDERLRLYHASDKVRQNAALLTIDDRCGHLHADSLRSRIRSYVLQAKVKVVIIDYLQLMPHVPETKNKETAVQIGETCRKLKEIAKEMNIPIILLSQLNRDVMKQPYGRPKMNNLRDSGGIEANADRVLMVWRPDYIGYNEVTDLDGTTIDTRGKVCVMQVKFRHGETGEVWLRFRSEYTRFESLENYSISGSGDDDVNWGNLSNRFGSGPANEAQGGHYSEVLPF